MATVNEQRLEKVREAIDALLDGKQEIRRGQRMFQGMTLSELQRLEQRYAMAVARESGSTVQQVVLRRRARYPRLRGSSA